MTELLTLCLVALIAGLLGFFLREVKEVLKRIEMAVRVLYTREKTKEQKEKRMGLAGPALSMDEYLQMEEDERLESLNRQT